MMNRRLAIAIVTVVVLVAAAGGFATFRGATPLDGHHDSSDPSAWTEVAWPFPLDQWGSGKAFKCKPADRGREANPHLRAPLRFSHFATAPSNAQDLDPTSDVQRSGAD